jgi:hypothetical protein
LRTADFLASLVRVATIRYSFMPDLSSAAALRSRAAPSSSNVAKMPR